MGKSIRGARVYAAVLMALVVALNAVPAQAAAPANEHFQRTWERTDGPVADGQANRTWMWGPEAFTEAMQEPYAESPDGMRTVQYFDKSRMEISEPGGDPGSPWYVTNGLLAREMIMGSMQTGRDTYQPTLPANINLAGDADDSSAPTYASFRDLLYVPLGFADEPITSRVDRSGTISDDPALAAYGVSSHEYVIETNHRVASVFWEFMTSNALVSESGTLVNAPLFPNPYYATGLPITEAYWANIKVANTYRDVLIQCFERRCLTYTPDNPPGWQVEAGNVGQHYYQWRYGDAPNVDPTLPPPPPTPDPPAPEPGDEINTISDGIWLVGEDIEPGIYRNDDSSNLCYWARLSGLSDSVDDIIANGISSATMIVEIKETDRAFESDRCGTWSSDQTPITTSPTASFDDGTYFVNTEVAPGLWRTTEPSDGCYWERLNGFSGTLDDIVANEFTDVHQVVEIESGDAGFHTSGCGTWTLNAGPVTSSPTADFGNGTFIVGVDIQAGVWETGATLESCYWARLDGFSGTLLDINDNEFIDEDDASGLPQRVTISPSDAGFSTSGCGTWSYVGP